MAGEITKDPGWQFLRQSPEQLIKETTKKFDSKKNVWIHDADEGFIPVEIKSTKGDMVVVVGPGGKEKTVKKDETQEMNPPKYEKTEDMANLTFLNDASVLHNLKQRYYAMMIYTYSGLFCVVINPYKRLPIYTESVCKMYIGKRRNEMPPHLFAVADEAYRNMVNDHENQSMLITGESGAGKTENTKKVISYFAAVGASQSAKKKVEEGKRKDATLEDQIVRTNPVLEAFGNAKTVRNNNSSRFGKFIRIHFNTAGKMAGGDIEHYLLEKSRVIKQAPGERCYHIFYQIMSEAVKGLRDKLHLSKSVRDYHFVSQAEITIDGIDDKEEMQMTDESFDIMAFTEEEKFNLYALTAAIMHMGEIKFKQRPREEQAECENQVEGELACKLFKCDVEKFIGALLKPRVKIGGEWVSKGQNLDQVNWAVGALAKALYARMFKWLIFRCNKTLDAQDFSRDIFIGVLDIAGFEIFDLNSFEQMWINFVNEKLQQFFNHHMFVLEQEEYKREGIKWTFIDFGLDLQATIDLIEKPLGIISCLDEECIVPKATDLTFGQKVMDQHLGKHPNLQKPKAPKGKQSEAHFAIVHYAGVVRYNVRSWLEKNKDPLNETVVSVLKANDGMQLLSDVWEDYVTQEDVDASAGRGGVKKKKGKAGSFMTVSMMYRESLNKLMNMLYQTHPHFIRCIIPNEKKQSGLIEAALVLNQLTCNGVLEGIRICRKGFPNRVVFKDFNQRYAVLAPAASKSGKTYEESSKKILDDITKREILKPEEYQVGRTKVFFKAGILARLEEHRDDAMSIIIGDFQRQLRWYLAKLEHKRRHEAKYGPIIDKEAEERERREREEKERREREERERIEREERARKEREAREKREREERERKEKLVNELDEKIKKFEDKLSVEEKGRKECEELKEKLESEKDRYKNELEREKQALAASEKTSQELTAQKKELERQVKDLNEKLNDLEDRHTTLTKQKAKNDQENASLVKKIQDLEQNIKRQEDDKQEKDQKIREYQEQMASQDQVIGRLTKEKKGIEEQNRSLLESFNSEEDKAKNLNKAKAILEQKLDEIEGNLEKERRLCQEAEKNKRKIEGELKVVQENIDELNRQKLEIDGVLKKKEADHAAMTTRLDNERALVAKLQRQIKELLIKIAELEDELEKERQNRARMERSRNEKQQELIETSERLEEAGGSAQIQADLTRKRELELAKLKRELEEVRLNQENDLTAMKKKHKEVMDELNDQANVLQEGRSKVEKDKAKLAGENTDLQQSLDEAIKQRQNMERIRKQLEIRLSEIQAKEDQQNRQLQELSGFKSKFSFEHGGLTGKLAEAESRINEMNRLKQQLGTQAEELRAQIEEEARQRQQLTAQLTNYQFERQQLRDEIEEEQENNSEMRRLISKANNEAQQWRTRFESEGLNRSDELEDSRRKLQLRVQELQDQIDQAYIKMSNLDKTRENLQRELTHMQSEADQANAHAISLEKRQLGFDKIVEEWKRKAGALSAELEASQREFRESKSESYRLKNALEGSHEQAEVARRENKALAQDLKDLQDQLGDGGKNVTELQKLCRRLELENEEMQQAFGGMEARIESEEAQLMRAQVEVSQIRSEIEKRLQEKEEEFENTRKNHKRALEYMNASLENETRSKAELMRHKKKMETEITELEIALDQQNKMNLEAQKNIKHYQESIQDLQQLIDEEQRNRGELRDQLAKAERRVQVLQNEKEELFRNYQQAERALRQAEKESARETIQDLSNNNSILSFNNRKLEQEIHAVNSEIKAITNNLRNSEERAKNAAIDAARFAEALHSEQDHAQDLEAKLKSYELQIRDMQAQLEEVENLNSAGFRKKIAQFEIKIRELQGLIGAESKQHQETMKNLKERDRIAKELQVRVEEDKVGAEKVYDLINKLQSKIKTYKKQVEEAEELAGTNLMKYRQLQHMLEDAETRADLAESNLAKIRLQGSRSSTSVRRDYSSPSLGAQHRSRSRNRGI